MNTDSENTFHRGGAEGAEKTPLTAHDARAVRVGFLKTLHWMDADGRKTLLLIEDDAELRALIEVACAEKFFEVAAEIKRELKRRGREVLTN